MRRFSIARRLFIAAFVNFSCTGNSKDDSTDEAASEAETSSENILLESSVLVNGGDLPDDLKCVRDGGDGKSPPLAWRYAPAGTESFAILMYHYPHGAVPGKDNPNHYWLLWNIPSAIGSLSRGNPENIGTEGSDKDGVHTGYTPPCSPVGSGAHTYSIRIYALSGEPSSLGSADSVAVGYEEFAAAMEPLTLETAELTFSESN